jgi:hypothetical protein
VLHCTCQHGTSSCANVIFCTEENDKKTQTIPAKLGSQDSHESFETHDSPETTRTSSLQVGERRLVQRLPIPSEEMRFPVSQATKVNE